MTIIPNPNGISDCVRKKRESYVVQFDSGESDNATGHVTEWYEFGPGYQPPCTSPSGCIGYAPAIERAQRQCRSIAGTTEHVTFWLEVSRAGSGLKYREVLVEVSPGFNRTDFPADLSGTASVLSDGQYFRLDEGRVYKRAAKQ